MFINNDDRYKNQFLNDCLTIYVIEKRLLKNLVEDLYNHEKKEEHNFVELMLII